MLKKIEFLFIDLSCDRVRHRFPDIGMVTSVRRNIQIRSQKIQNMAKTQERDHVFTVFLHVIPLRRFPVQNKVDILFILFHTVFKKVKTIFLRGDTEFFVNQPYMMFLEEFAEYFINSKSGQFLYSETESVMWLPVTASKQETVTGAAHREIHEITPTDIVPSEK